VQSLAGVATIVGFFIVPRLSLVLPGIALGRDDATLATAWRVSKRNTWRMIWAYFFCILPWIAISAGMSYWLFLHGHNRVVLTLVSIVRGLLWIPGGIL
jgi:membrane-anchored glycerophosphoryl diester phosphodiesterase (GDPDase)